MAVSPSDERRTSSAKFLGIETELQKNQISEREATQKLAAKRLTQLTIALLGQKGRGHLDAVQKIYHLCHTTSVKAVSLDFSFVTPPI
ncbi:unnamed protein product [Ixodes pacificus]